ncbi:hypothetical protein GGR50DRAFT_640316 [Xylaria sp. CBS 124048]|nr:hypothetical protein GGR50DRAFT_640316 [Xylaria sp. CBS 124048]
MCVLPKQSSVSICSVFFVLLRMFMRSTWFCPSFFSFVFGLFDGDSDGGRRLASLFITRPWANEKETHHELKYSLYL